MDRYIDNLETQTYGAGLCANLKIRFAKSDKPTKDFVAHLVDKQERADAVMRDAMSNALGASTDLSDAAAKKAPDADAARRLLAGFHGHLTSKRLLGEWSGRIELFFKGGLAAAPKSNAEILEALRTAQKGLEKDKSVPDAKKFAKRLGDAHKKLSASADKSRGAMKAAQTGLSEQAAEKKAWLRTYRGIAQVAQGLLVLEGRPADAASLLPHLAVASPKKKKSAASKKSAPAGGPVQPSA